MNLSQIGPRIKQWLWWPGVVALALTSLASGCGDDAPADDPLATTFLGVFTIPRGVPSADPLLNEAYGDVVQAGFGLSGMRLSWGATELQLGIYDWLHFDNHANQSRRKDVPLGVELALIDNRVQGDRPTDLGDQWIDGGNLRVRFARFCQDVVRRGRGQVRFLWVGREVDVYLAEHPDELETFRELLRAVQDSIRVIDPGVRVGTILAFSEAEESGVLSTSDAIADGQEWLGLSIYGRDADYAATLDPEETIERVMRGVGRYPNSKLVVTETAFSGAQAEQQEDFVRLLTDYLDEPPSHLYGAVWHAISDYSPEEAESVAGPLYEDEPGRRAAYIDQLRGNGLKEANGAQSLAWLYLIRWSDDREVSPGVLSP